MMHCRKWMVPAIVSLSAVTPIVDISAHERFEPVYEIRYVAADVHGGLFERFFLSNIGKWYPLDGYGKFDVPTIGRPAIVHYGQRRLSLFTTTTDGKIAHKWHNPGKNDFVHWQPLAHKWQLWDADTIEPPTAVSWGEGRIDLFATRRDGKLMHKWFDAGVWTPEQGWEVRDANIQGSITATSWGANRLDLFAVSRTGSLLFRWFDLATGGWGPSNGWEEWPGNFYGQPSAVSWEPGRLDVFVPGKDAHLWHRWFDLKAGGRWSHWERWQVPLAGSPVVVSRGPGSLDVFAIANDQKLVHRSFKSEGGWLPKDGWNFIGTGVTGTPSVVVYDRGNSGRMHVFALGVDNTLRHRWWGWVPEGGQRWSPPQTMDNLGYVGVKDIQGAAIVAEVKRSVPHTHNTDRYGAGGQTEKPPACDPKDIKDDVFHDCYFRGTADAEAQFFYETACGKGSSLSSRFNVRRDVGYTLPIDTDRVVFGYRFGSDDEWKYVHAWCSKQSKTFPLPVP